MLPFKQGRLTYKLQWDFFARRGSFASLAVHIRRSCECMCVAAGRRTCTSSFCMNTDNANARRCLHLLFKAVLDPRSHKTT